MSSQGRSSGRRSRIGRNRSCRTSSSNGWSGSGGGSGQSITSEAARRNWTTFVTQYSYDYFDFFLDARAGPYPGAEAREFWFQDVPVPKWSRPEDRDPSFDEYRRISIHNPNPRFHLYRRNDDGSDRTMDPAILERLQSLGLEVGRILGAGSQGVAVAVKFNGQQMVLKYSMGLDDGGVISMIQEMWAMRMSKGAKHIIQVSDLLHFHRCHSMVFQTYPPSLMVYCL